MPGPPELPQSTLPLVGQAIQNLAAARLGRAFIPLGLLFLVGMGEMMSGARGWVLAGGAPLAAAGMLAHSLRVVQRAFGRPQRLWMVLAPAAGVFPLMLGVYVFGWRGLRALSAFDGLGELAAALFFTVVGLWVLRGWVNLLELGQLTDSMIMADGTGGDQ